MQGVDCLLSGVHISAWNATIEDSETHRRKAHTASREEQSTDGKAPIDEADERAPQTERVRFFSTCENFAAKPFRLWVPFAFGLVAGLPSVDWKRRGLSVCG